MTVQLVKISVNNYCVIDLSDDWREGRALNTDTKAYIYYNGDYGDPRPKYIKRLIAERNELGFVQKKSPLNNEILWVKPISKATRELAMIIKQHGGVCTLEENKQEGKYVITLP